MSVSLAIAVAMSRLVARRAGARIESLVVDEPDGLDSPRSARLRAGAPGHRPPRRAAAVVLVSHHDDLAEFADATYQVTKGPQGSVVELTALVVDVVGPDEPDDVSDLRVNVTAWHHGGEPFSRTLVPVDPSPSTEADHNSFHLTRQCPWSR
jgi:hypothetical protein